MSADSLKRLLVLILSSAALLLSSKLGLNLDAAHITGFVAMVVGFLGQSGLNAALGKMAANKSAQALFADLAKLQGALQQVRAAQAQAAGVAAAAAPGSPSAQ